MQGQSGGTAVSESIKSHGVIEFLSIPEGFTPAKLSDAEKQFNNVEFKYFGSTMRICYEQMPEALMDDDIAEMEKVFAEKLDSGSRPLNLYGDQDGPDDSMVYGGLCQCFVYGGALARDGSIIDMEKSKWELRTIGGTTMIVAKLKFNSCNGNASKREALLVIPTAPSQAGCGYIWLEGTFAEVRSAEQAFLSSIAEGKFKRA